MPINVAVVGLGKMGISHLSILNALDDFRVVAMCDSSRMVGKVLEKYTGINYVADYEQLLQLDGLDAVVIATPTSVHEPMVRAALDRGLHVFCEKPLTLSGRQSEQLHELATGKKLVGQVGYHNRFIGTFSEAQRLISGGGLGRIRHVLAEAYGPVVLRPSKATWRSKPGAGGGCLYDYAAHPLNLLNWFFGRPEACLASELKSTYSADVDDEVYAMLRFAGGVTSQLSVNWSDPSVRKMTTRISVWGERGKLFVDRQELQAFFEPGTSPPHGFEQGWNVTYITDVTPGVSFYLRGEEYSAQLEAFGRAIKAGQGAERNDFGSAADTDFTIEQIRRRNQVGSVADPSPAFLPQAAERRGFMNRIFAGR